MNYPYPGIRLRFCSIHIITCFLFLTLIIPVQVIITWIRKTHACMQTNMLITYLSCNWRGATAQLQTTFYIPEDVRFNCCQPHFTDLEIDIAVYSFPMVTSFLVYCNLVHECPSYNCPASNS